MVWFTGMGLTVGLLMVFFLLWLILSQGISVFWPRDVVQITLVEGSTAGINGSKQLGGEINQVRERYVARPPDQTVAEEQPIEWQLFIGNRQINGLSFKYLDESQIASTAYPPNAIVIERLEYGDAIGIPVELTTPDGKVISADSEAFNDGLKQYFKKTLDRRAEILQIEKKEIGKLNSKMRAIDLRVRRAELKEKLTEEIKTTAEAEKAELNKKFETLNAERLALREEQEKGALKLNTLDGRELSVPLQQFVYYYYPNDLGVFGKLGVFFHQAWAFVSTEPREANMEGGIFPAIFGTFIMTLLLSVAVTPFGVVAAIYLREYAKQGFLVRSVRIAVNNLAGVPSIVFGVFGLGFFVYVLGANIDQWFFQASLPTPTFGTGGIFWASLTLALMTVPVVIVSTEEGLASVPRGMRDASLACGASKWQTIQRIVLPASSSGILTGLILAMARGAGEVAPLMLVGVVKLAPTLPLDGDFPFLHLDRKFMHLGFHIYDLGFQSPDSEAAKPMVFATTLLLIVLVVLLNLSAIMIRERLRRKFATGAF